MKKNKQLSLFQKLKFWNSLNLFTAIFFQKMLNEYPLYVKDGQISQSGLCHTERCGYWSYHLTKLLPEAASENRFGA
jgi:hypothetical protein